MASNITFEAIGTSWNIVIEDELAPDAELKLMDQIRERIEVFDKSYSRFRTDSLIMEMAENAGEYELPEDAEMLFDLYRDVYEQTGGLVTPLVGQLLSDAGYDATYSLKPKLKLSTPPLWEESLVYAFPKLTLLQPVLLDLGAAGKGYLVDIVSRIIIDAGVASFCVNAGGDIYAYSEMGVDTRVALEHPDDPTLSIGIATITNQSICGSAGNRRVWDNYHHIINPKTLVSPRHIRAVWVVAEAALLADALTTCLFFVAPSILNERYSYEYLIVYEDYSVEQSSTFPAELFKN